MHAHWFSRTELGPRHSKLPRAVILSQGQSSHCETFSVAGALMKAKSSCRAFGCGESGELRCYRDWGLGV